MKRKTLVDEYMNEIIDYGGLYWTPADVIRDMQRMGIHRALLTGGFRVTNWLQRFESGDFVESRCQQRSLSSQTSNRPSETPREDRLQLRPQPLFLARSSDLCPVRIQQHADRS